MGGLYFVSNFNEVLDECADKPVKQLETAVKYCLKRHNVADDGLASKTILAHILTEFAVTTVQSFCDKLQELEIPFSGLLGWRITKIQMATREFYFRALRNIPNDVLKEMSNMVAPIVSLLTEEVAKYENFRRAYEYAIEEERKQ